MLLLRAAVDQAKGALVSVDAGRLVATHKRSWVRISIPELFLEVMMLTKKFSVVDFNTS